MHYVLATHTTDITTEHMIERMHSTALGVDKKMLVENGFCSCINYTFPVVREIHLFEVDVLDPAAKPFEKLLKQLGFSSFKPRGIVRKLANWIYHRVWRGVKSDVEFMDLEREPTAFNQRSFVIFKKADDEWKKEGHFEICRNCNGKYPVVWT